jgi:cytoskeletal protein RodZ
MTIAERLNDLNRWYDGLPDDRRVFVYPGVLLAAALVSAKWTGSPFGWLFLAAVAALVLIRKVYAPVRSEALAGGPTAHAAPPRPFVAQPAPVRPISTPPQPPVAAQPAASSPPASPVVPPPVVQPAATPDPAPQPTIQAAPVAPIIAAQPAARPAPQSAPPSVPSAPTVDGPAPRPAPAAATGAQKKTNAPPPRKNEGRSGRRKPGDKHP